MYLICPSLNTAVRAGLSLGLPVAAQPQLPCRYHEGVCYWPQLLPPAGRRLVSSSVRAHPWGWDSGAGICSPGGKHLKVLRPRKWVRWFWMVSQRVKCELSGVRAEAVLHPFFEFCWRFPPRLSLPLAFSHVSRTAWTNSLLHFWFASFCSSTFCRVGLWVLQWVHSVSCSALQPGVRDTCVCTHRKMFKAAWRTQQKQLELWHAESTDIGVIYYLAFLGT